MTINRPLILASKSPRRSQLLSQAGFTFTVRAKDVEENYPSSLAPENVPAYLAEKKATACLDFIEDQEIIIAADTIVILGDTIYEKPKDYEDAVRILRALSGSVHQVITGVCLLAKEKKTVFSGYANVYFNELTDAEIAYYIKTFQPYDKAGAYAIQEWLGLCKIAKIEGTYANIMGLPVDLVYEQLQKYELS